MSETVQRPLSIEQAFNWLKEVKDNIVKRVKKTVADNAQISIAPPKDRLKFLKYGISLLREVDSENMELFCKVTGKSKNMYSSSELAEFFRKLLTLTIHKVPIERIAQELGTPVEVLKRVELIAIVAVNRAIKKANVDSIPILGG